MYSYRNDYIGARDFVTDGTFTWSDGASNAFASTEKTVWGGTLPTASSADLKDWVYMASSGTWTPAVTATTKYDDTLIIIIIIIQNFTFNVIAGHSFVRGKTMSSWVH